MKRTLMVAVVLMAACGAWAQSAQANECVQETNGEYSKHRNCWDGGKRRGRWVIRLPGGEVREGAYVAGKKQGHWVVRLPDGGVQERPYVAGEKQGRWVLRYADGTVEEGPVAGGLREGRWMVRRPDGSRRTFEMAGGRLVEGSVRVVAQEEPQGAPAPSADEPAKPLTTFRDCPGCPEMVVAPAGRFRMGSASGDDDERPVHPVTFARPFAVGVYEVTRGEFARFVEATGRSMGDSCWTVEGGEGEWRSGRHWRRPGFSQTDAHPVVCVNWEDAQAYVAWLSGETGEAYRLLSESEWEYVARAGAKTARYWWGDEIGRNRASCDGCGSRWDGKQTAPVGSFPASPFGLYDVHGNAGEWVEDCWNGSYDGAPRDGSAWTSGDCDARGLRGGSWVNPPWDLRSARRDRFPTILGGDSYGFRVARTLTP